MEVQKCYCASFNVGNVEAWGTELYKDKNSVIQEIENSSDDILEAISKFSLLDETEIIKYINQSMIDLREFGFFKQKDEQFDFFILENHIFDNYEQKKL